MSALRALGAAEQDSRRLFLFTRVLSEQLAALAAPFIFAHQRDAVYHYERLRNMRISAELRIEVWRTREASRRKGNVV